MNEPITDPTNADDLVWFSLEDAPTQQDEEYVVRWGKIFEAGDYPQRQFSLTPEELAAAAEAFEPVPVDLAHVPDNDNVLAGKLGELAAVRVGDDGRTLLGGVKLPRWLDNILGPNERKVSAAWNRATKRLAKLALTTRPVVPDAALMAAFAEFSAGEHEQGQTPTNEDKQPPTKEIRPMADNQTKTEDAPASAPALSAEQIARFSQIEAENAVLKKQVAQLAERDRQRAAEQFVERWEKANKAYPAEHDILVAAFKQASLDDEALEPAGLATFSDGKPARRIDVLEALLDARPAYSLDRELVAEKVNKGEAVVLFSKTQTTDRNGGELSEERRRELLGASALGQTVLADRAAK